MLCRINSTNVIIGAETLGQDGRPTRLVGANVGYLFLVWVIVFFGNGFGVRWTGQISYVTMVCEDFVSPQNPWICSLTD